MADDPYPPFVSGDTADAYIKVRQLEATRPRHIRYLLYICSD